MLTSRFTSKLIPMDLAKSFVASLKEIVSISLGSTTVLIYSSKDLGSKPRSSKWQLCRDQMHSIFPRIVWNTSQASRSTAKAWAAVSILRKGRVLKWVDAHWECQRFFRKAFLNTFLMNWDEHHENTCFFIRLILIVRVTRSIDRLLGSSRETDRKST